MNNKSVVILTHVVDLNAATSVNLWHGFYHMVLECFIALGSMYSQEHIIEECMVD